MDRRSFLKWGAIAAFIGLPVAASETPKAIKIDKQLNDEELDDLRRQVELTYLDPNFTIVESYEIPRYL